MFGQETWLDDAAGGLPSAANPATFGVRPPAVVRPARPHFPLSVIGHRSWVTSRAEDCFPCWRICMR